MNEFMTKITHFIGGSGDPLKIRCKLKNLFELNKNKKRTYFFLLKSTPMFKMQIKNAGQKLEFLKLTANNVFKSTTTI